MALLIAEFEELELYCTQIEDTLARTNTALFTSLPPRPISRAMIEEKYRSKIYGPRVQANREYMRRLRALVRPSISKAQQEKDYDERLLAELKNPRPPIPEERQREISERVETEEERLQRLAKETEEAADIKPTDLAPGKLKL
jgi:hypothetical protein